MKIIPKFITKDDSYRNNVNKVDSTYKKTKSAPDDPDYSD